MRYEPERVRSDNLSHAWAQAFLRAYDAAHPPPLIITVECASAGAAIEDSTVRDTLDAALVSAPKSCPRVADNAAMIFPYRLWDSTAGRDRGRLFDLYPRMEEKLRARGRVSGKAASTYGTYFGRMMAFEGADSEGKPKTVNQLEEIIRVWDRDTAGGRRTKRSSLQVTCLDPGKDLTGQAMRGFPCLQQVSFDYDDRGGLTVWAYYPTQFMFDRAYGNYLGLTHLGEFMAHEMRLRFVRLVCVVASPDIGGATKGYLAELAETVRCRIPPEQRGRLL